MIPQKDHYQRKLHCLVSELLQEYSRSAEMDSYQSVLPMIYTIIEDDKLKDLDLVLRRNFPKYYSMPIPYLLPEN